MRPVDLQPIGEELAIRWEDRSEGFIRLETLRRACPCAGCKGETDVLGNLHRGPERSLDARSFVLVRMVPVGGYGVQPVWADGHSTGIFSFDYLQRLTQAQPTTSSNGA
jgi:DUF971 family protein